MITQDYRGCAPNPKKENKYRVKNKYMCKPKAAKILKCNQITVFEIL